VREPSSVYLVRSTWQHTDLGRLPSDWNVKQIGELQPFVTSGSRGWARFYSETGSPFIRITNLSRSRICLDLADLRSVNLPASDSEGARTQLAVGDVLISVTADIGIVGYVSARVPTPAYINQHIALVRFDRFQVNPKFVSYFLASEQPQRRFRSLTDAGAKAGMNLPTVRAVQVALPPTVREQGAIAEALSDTDALIESLEQLLAKKRQIKQGAMQELLTGQRRLPGFQSCWPTRSLGALAEMSSGGTPSTSNHANFASEGTPWVSIADLTSSGKWIAATERSISQQGLLNCAAHIYPAGTVLYAMYASLGECSIAKLPLTSSQAILGIQPRPALLNEFLYYHLQWFKSRVKGMGQQGTQANLNKGMVQAFQIALPNQAEQGAIATTLSDIDAELTALEARLAKTRQIKQGMMQALLTGRIRLVPPQEEQG
jgi:type I restriction enzyme, S subunit